MLKTVRNFQDFAWLWDGTASVGEYWRQEERVSTLVGKVKMGDQNLPVMWL